MFIVLAQSISTDYTDQGVKAQYHKEMYYILSLPVRGPIKPQKY